MAELLDEHGEFGALGAEDLERRLRFVDFTKEDFARVTAMKSEVLDHLDALVAVFFDYLKRFDEARGLTGNPALLEDARRLKREHLVAMVQGKYDADYVAQRFRLGLIYNRAQLDVALFMGAFHALVSAIGERIVSRFPGDAATAFAHYRSFKKVVFFDLPIIFDGVLASREQIIRRQQEAIRELSTPTLLLRERLLILPIIGLLDSHRARQLTEISCRRSARIAPRSW